MKKQSKMILIIVGGILLAVAIAVTALLMVSAGDNRKFQKHMEAAQKYLDELQYEQAIAEYELAIEIEPNNIEAYQALAELYVQTEDYESAMAVLNRGIEQTESDELADYLEEVQTDWEEKQAHTAQGQQDAQQQESSEDSQDSAAENGPREETEYFADGSCRIYEYSEKGNLLKWTWYNADGTIKQYDIYEYDGSENLIKDTVHNTDGTIWGYYVYEYDINGNLLKRTEYDAIGTILFVDKFDYEYDENGNLLKTTWYNADGMIWHYYIYEYDVNGNRTKVTSYYADGTIDYVEVYD